MTNDKLNRICDYPMSTLENASNFIFEDWDVPKIEVKYNSRLKRYAGKYIREFWAGRKMREWIELMKFKGMTYKHIYKVLAHECAHYIQHLMYGYSDHDKLFDEINTTIYDSLVKEMS